MTVKWESDLVITSMITDLIKSILKSLVILAIWLALSGAIYSQIAPFFALNRTLSLSHWEWDSTTKQQIRFQGYFKVINKISGKWKAKNRCVENFATTITKTLFLLLFFWQKLTNLFNYNFWMTITSSFRLKTYFNGSFQLSVSILMNILVICRQHLLKIMWYQVQ